MLRLLIYGVPGTPVFELGERIAQFYETDYFTIENVPEERDSYFDDKIPEVSFDTGDFSTGSDSQHMVRDPSSLRLEQELGDADPIVPDSDFEDKLENEEIDCIYGMNQGVVATQIPDRDLINWSTHVVYLEGDEKRICDWFDKRRFCPVCESVYHLEDKVPLVLHRCDRCGTDLIQKDDDHAGTIKEEFKVWRNSFWGFEETAKNQKKFKRINVEKIRDFDDLSSRVNLWVRKDFERRSLNWWSDAIMGDDVDEARI